MVEWWETAKPGDVRQKEFSASSAHISGPKRQACSTQSNVRSNLFEQVYDPFSLSPFSNALNREEVFMAGTTHIAVGFVDLGSLLTCILLDEDPDIGTGPLRWIGIDSQPYCVAKTLVIAQMLRSDPDVEDVIQALP